MGRGGNGKGGRTGVVICGCLFRHGGPQPVLVRPGASDGLFVAVSCAPLLLCSPFPVGLELRRGSKTMGTPIKNCLPGLPVIVSGGWLACGKER